MNETITITQLKKTCPNLCGLLGFFKHSHHQHASLPAFAFCFFICVILCLSGFLLSHQIGTLSLTLFFD